jgi:hypothetical protein
VTNRLSGLDGARYLGGTDLRAGAQVRAQVRWTRLYNDTQGKESYNAAFVIERNIPGAGKLSQQELKAISQKSCGVLQELGPQIQWVHSYVTGDKIYCVYIAPDEMSVRKHAEMGGFPANSVSEIYSVIDPVTAE